MRIAGIHKNSFVDYPGKMAAVVFTPGCNMNCYYCHNRSLINADLVKSLYHQDAFFNFLEKRKGFLDAVVITGGEPTIQPGLEDFIERVKNIGYLVKLDTNGTRPQIVDDLVNKGLLDYVAMDIKAPLHRYEEICGLRIPVDDIQTSIELLKEEQVPYEFRTTFVPQLDETDALEMGKMIRGARLYIVQQFRKPQGEEQFWDQRLHQPAHSPEFIRKIAERMHDYVRECEVRGI